MADKDYTHGLAGLALCALLAVLLIEGYTATLWIAAQALVVLLALAEVLAGEWRERSRRSWRRHPLVTALWSLVGLAVLMAGAAHATGGAGQTAAALRAFGGEFAPVLYFLLVVWHGRRHLSAGAPAPATLPRIIDGLIWLWFGLVLLSSAAALDPAIAFAHLRQDTAVFVFVYLVAVEAATGPLGFRRMTRTFAIAGFLGCLGACSVYSFFSVQAAEPSGYAICEYMLSHDLVHQDRSAAEVLWRVSWPALRPERLGAFALICFYGLLLGAARMQKGELKVLWSVCAAAPAAAAYFCFSSGAMQALAAGLAALWLLTGWIVLQLPRQRWWLPALLVPPALVAALAISAGVFSGEGFGPWLPAAFRDSSPEWQQRQYAWRGAWRMARENPVLGVGHGESHYEAAYLAFQDERDDYNPLQPHARANALEELAENGFPAAAVRLAVGLLLGLALLLAFARERADVGRRFVLAALIALHASCAAYGLCYFTQSGRVGCLLWIAVAWSVAALRGGAAPADGPNQTADGEVI